VSIYKNKTKVCEAKFVNLSSFSAFTESNGQLLIDLSLYVSSQNYYAATSPAYGAILTWPNQWILPPKLRTRAKNRTAHLGLSSLDLEANEEERTRERSAAAAAGQIPKNLIARPRETVSTLLGKTAQNSRFRLEALTADLFEPLEQLLAGKAYLLSDQEPSTLDALVVGYLSFGLVPGLPAPWFAEALQSKAPRLAKYVARVRDECFGVVDVADAFKDTPSPSSKLPWRQPERVNAGKIGSTLLNTLADATPILSDLRANDRLRESVKSLGEEVTPLEAKIMEETAAAKRKDMFLSIASVAAGVTAMVGYLFYHGIISVVREDEQNQNQNQNQEEGYTESKSGSAQSILQALL
jgi:sorting and assembly machinery component 37